MKKAIMTVAVAAACSASADINPLMIGDPIPEVTLKTAGGKSFDLQAAAEQQPLALIFYRGGWCPYCNTHLGQLQEIDPQLRKLGYRILAVSPDKPAKLAKTSTEEKLTYTLLSDASVEAAKAFGLAFTVDDATLEKYKGYGIDLEEASGQTHNMLPVPAVFLIGTDGVIDFVYANPDYKTRLDPAVLLEVAKGSEIGLHMKKWVKPISIVVMLGAVLILGGRTLNLQDRLVDAMNWIRALGPAGMAVFTGLYIAACVLFIPGSILTLGAGAIYGVVQGTILVSVASTLGAAAAFWVGRFFARKWVAQKIEGNARFRAIDDAVADEGWKIVLLTRLSPVFSFNLLNYAYGLTRVPAREYIPASWIGMLPGTLMYVYLGSLAGDLASLGAENQNAPGPARWTINILAFLATVGVTVYVTKIARKALSEKIDE